jgi:hypothetical protein
MIAQLDDHKANRAKAERDALDHVAERLVRRFAHVDAEEIRRAVNREFDAYADARIRDFIPILVERAVSESLPRPRLRSSA